LDILDESTNLGEELQGEKPSMRNPVSWFEIPVHDIARATAFYEYVFGCSLSQNDLGPLKMALFPMGDPTLPGATGSLVQHSLYQPSHQGTLIYFNVTDIESTLERVTARGGKVINAKRSIGQFGFVAHFEDSEGNRVALHSLS
jgi:predicted enzyme related to lactoylglutathione lyase